MTESTTPAPLLAPTAKLAAALAQVQAELPKLERDRTVEVTKKDGGTYSYSYATLANVSDAVLPLLARHGLSFIAMPGTGSDGKMCVRYSLMHESGEALTGEFPISGDGGIQMIGGRITYARRYCLAAVVGIAADEDDESRLSDEPRPAQRAAQRSQRRASTPTPDQGAATVQRSAPRAAARPPLPGEDDQPAPPAPETAADLTRAQLTKLHTVFSAIGWTDRNDRLRASSIIVGRSLGTSNDLTKEEAKTLIDTLDSIAEQPDPADKLTELLTRVREAETDEPTEGGAK